MWNFFGPAEVGPSEVGLVEVGPAEIGPYAVLLAPFAPGVDAFLLQDAELFLVGHVFPRHGDFP
jgi:hypothetical protein